MKVGDNIRVVGLPDKLEDDGTKLVFERCLGKAFPIVGIVPVPETGSELYELHVGHVVGKLPVMHSIWIEREFVERV